MDIQEAFRILGIKSSATDAEVKEAYRDCVAISHPDLQAHHARRQLKATEQLKQINLAYETVTQFRKSSRYQQQSQKNGRTRKEKPERHQQASRQHTEGEHTNNFDTAERGIQATIKMIGSLGGKDLRLHKEGNKRFISFVSPHGKHFKVTTRAKQSGTWQTSTTYGKPCLQNHLESEYWVFVDLEFDPPKFYPVPLWWILNDIYEVHQKYLKSFGGHRKHGGNSNHHSVQLKRIKSWEGQWKNMDL